MAHIEKTISSEKIFDGHVFSVTVDCIEQENGRKSTREVVHHNGGMCVCAVDEMDNVFLVRQFRYAFGTELLELPAGKRDGGEDPLQGARRELREETGVLAAQMHQLGEFYPSPGYLTEVLYAYYATGLSYTDQDLDEGEFLDVIKVPFEEAVKMAVDGTIKDGKTIAVLLKADAMRRAGN